MSLPQAAPPFFFDGHNDVLLRLLHKADPVTDFIKGDGQGHLDLPRMKASGFCGGLFAIYVPSPSDFSMDPPLGVPSYILPLPPAIPQPEAQAVAVRMASLLLRLEAASAGALTLCKSANDIRDAIDNQSIAAVIHMEGAEAIDPDFAMLDVLYAAGLRSLGPVWSRPTLYGHGVPFAFPSSPDTGPGLTDHGKALVKACNARRIALDLSHLNEQGFWDVAALSDAPLIASHSNAHALSPHSRNLTDKQLHAIRESGGLVGVNFAVQFIRADGQLISATPLEDLLRHLDHLINHLGIDGVGLGSDFDGATTPATIGDVTGLPRLADAMRQHGYDEPTIRKLCQENWISVLERTWGV